MEQVPHCQGARRCWVTRLLLVRHLAAVCGAQCTVHAGVSAVIVISGQSAVDFKSPNARGELSVIGLAGIAGLYRARRGRPSPGPSRLRHTTKRHVADAASPRHLVLAPSIDRPFGLGSRRLPADLGCRAAPLCTSRATARTPADLHRRIDRLLESSGSFSEPQG